MLADVGNLVVYCRMDNESGLQYFFYGAYIFPEGMSPRLGGFGINIYIDK